MNKFLQEIGDRIVSKYKIVLYDPVHDRLVLAECRYRMIKSGETGWKVGGGDISYGSFYTEKRTQHWVEIGTL